MTTGTPTTDARDELLHRLAFAEAVTRATPDCLYVYDVVTNEFRYQNMTVQELLGYDVEMLSQIPGDFYAYVGHPDETELAFRAMAEQKELPPGDVIEYTYRLRTSSNEYRWYSLRVTAFTSDEDGRPKEVLGLIRDVHDAVDKTLRLHESERRFRELFDRSPVGIALVSDDGAFVEVNDALCDFLAMTRLEVIGSCYDDVIHPDQRAETRYARSVYSTQDARDVTRRNERRFVRADGTERWACTSSTRVVDGGETVNLVSFEDITATKDAEAKLRHAAMHDSLTGLPNRRMLIDALDAALSRRRRSYRPLAVMFVDLDRVKQVNDRLGHEAGDDTLVIISRRLEATMRGTDTVARVGGDEFVIVCPDLDTASEVPGLAERVLDALRITVVDPSNPGEPLHVSGSIGVALADDVLNNPNALVAAADRAMYDAKRDGRDRYHLAAPIPTGSIPTPAGPSTQFAAGQP